MAHENNVELHDIFTVDPVHLKNFVGRYVRAYLKDGKEILGVVYTIDPVSQSFILISSGVKSQSLHIILKHSINSIDILTEIPQDYEKININNIFLWNMDKKLHDKNKKMKEMVKMWLLKNMIPVEEKGELLTLDSLEIHPPYNIDSCRSSNSIVLDRVQNLLMIMKEEDGQV